jgi:hypothetical protein
MSPTARLLMALTLACGMAGVVLVTAADLKKSMRLCQRTASFETCHKALN